MRKYAIPPFVAPRWIQAAAQNLQPRERLSVSQWAERYRILDGVSSAMPGPWRNSITPYLQEIMDAFSDAAVERIVFVKPTQVGGTTAMENMLGSLIDQAPGPTLIVYPSDDLAEGMVETKLKPMLQSCKQLAALYQESESKRLALKFKTMFAYLTGANSPSDLASKPIRYLFLDEVDKFPGASKREADPVSLAIERTKTFYNRKIVMASTPTLRTGHIWRAKEAAEVEKHYFVPCPHCGKYITLKMKQIRWPPKEAAADFTERTEKAVYLCQACGGVITDHDKGAMLRAGRWETVRGETKRPKSVAFWINTLYSPFTRFSEIAREFLRSHDDAELLHNFRNSWLAEPWEPVKSRTDASMVLERQTELPELALPAWTKLVTGGVDVQKNCLYWTIRAWGDHMTSQNIAHGQALDTGEIERVMNLNFPKPDGERLPVHLALVDSGDQTDLVYEFCLDNAHWALPCKGVADSKGHYRLSTVNKAGSRANGITLVLVNGGLYKDMIAANMGKPNGKGAWMVHKDCDLEYAEQVTAEHKVAEKYGGREIEKWQLKSSHADNHYLDCEVYAAAAADILGVRMLHCESLHAEQTAQTQPDAQQAAAEEAWIGQHENWL